MKALPKFLIFATLAISTITLPTHAATIANGSFENPAVSTGSSFTFGGGSAAITGWTVVGINSTIVSGSFIDTGITYQAQDGNQWIDLSGPGSNSSTNGVKQTIATTANQSYELSFFVGSATNSSTIFASTVDLSIDGGPRVSFTNPTAPSSFLDWELFTVQFTAASTTTDLTFYNGSAGDNHLSGLDNVSILSIPEPSSALLLMSGALLCLRRRPLT